MYGADWIKYYLTAAITLTMTCSAQHSTHHEEAKAIARKPIVWQKSRAA
jgi:hypothetical protein